MMYPMFDQPRFDEVVRIEDPEVETAETPATQPPTDSSDSVFGVTLPGDTFAADASALSAFNVDLLV